MLLSEDEILNCFDHLGREVLECIITFAEKPAVPFHHLVLSCLLRAQLIQDKQQQQQPPLSEQGQGNPLSDTQVDGNG